MRVSVGLYFTKYKYLKLTYFPFNRRCIILSSQSTQVCTRTHVEVCVYYASVPIHSGSSHSQLQAIINNFSKKNMLFCLHCCETALLNWDAFFAQFGINNTWPILTCGQPLHHQALTVGHSVCWTWVAWEEHICYSLPWHRLITWLEGANNGMHGFKRALHHCPQHFHCNKT